MATTAIGLPIFEGIHLLGFIWGYLDTINLNPYAAGGPPESWKRAMGILRSCMAGEAAECITSRGGANLAAFVALVIPEGVGGPNANTYVNGSQARCH
ncbi:unnamed protein product [Rhizophagus irregularis]|nr:unnamed protein product [Rhizophagus irregularis]